MIIASKGHIENVDSYDNPERVMLSMVLASPMRKSTFPLDGSCLGSMCKLDFLSILFLCWLFESIPLGLGLLIHVVTLKKDGHLKEYM